MLGGFEYPLIDPPYEFKPFEQMTRKEAQEHFEWFVRLSRPRRHLLVRAVAASGGNDALDCTRDSLVPLWTWAIPLLEAQEPTAEELTTKLKDAPEWVKKADISFKELTSETRCLCVDIGFYLAEVFVHRHPTVHWALWTRKTGPYHRPFLEGFPGPPLVPSDLIAGCAWSVIRGSRQGSLLRENFDHWEEKLSEDPVEM